MDHRAALGLAAAAAPLAGLSSAHADAPAGHHHETAAGTRTLFQSENAGVSAACAKLRDAVAA